MQADTLLKNDFSTWLSHALLRCNNVAESGSDTPKTMIGGTKRVEGSRPSSYASPDSKIIA
jgi:hypothetical protein